MTTKLKSSLMLLGALTTLSCSNAGNEFRITKFYPLGPGCDISIFEENGISPNAFLDVAAGSPVVVVGIEIAGSEGVKQLPVTVGQVTLEREDRNRPILTQQKVTYRLSKRVGGTPKPYLTNVNLPFSEDGKIFGTFQLLSPELGQALFDGLQPSPGTAPSNTIEDFVDISMDVEFTGEWSGTRNAFTTGILTYPVRAYRSNPGICDLDGNGVDDGFGFIKYQIDASSASNADVCAYVGQSLSQVAAPPVPSCCTARGPMGGCGC